MARANSTKAIAPWKHAKSGLWCVTRKGRRYYLGKTKTEATQRANRYQKSIERGLKIPELGTDETADAAIEPTVAFGFVRDAMTNRILVRQKGCRLQRFQRNSELFIFRLVATVSAQDHCITSRPSKKGLGLQRNNPLV